MKVLVRSGIIFVYRRPLVLVSEIRNIDFVFSGADSLVGRDGCRCLL